MSGMKMENTNRLSINNTKAMDTKAIALSANESIIDVLNLNKIAEDVKDKAVALMGLAACQIHCLKCQYCSDGHCGNR